MSRRIIIDTDPGVDDAIAILMALASPELEVLGLTTVFGNAATAVTTKNALALLEAAGRPGIPVAVGASKPIASDYLGPVPMIHGANGLGGEMGVQPVGSAVQESAVELLYSTAATHPGQVTILALGPLTNLAVALELHPDLPDLVDEVVVMGGNALVPGNVTPVAEANINNDPEAADLVFGADWRVTMVGLDVTHQIVLSGASIDRISAGSNPEARLLAEAIPIYRAFFRTHTGLDGIFAHDPATIAYLLEPDIFTTEAWPIRVETESFSRGKTWPNTGRSGDRGPSAWSGRPPVNVCTEVVADRVVALIEDRLSNG